MPTLFQSLNDVPSARAAAILTEAICNDAYGQLRSLLQSIEPGEVHVPLADISPDVGSFYSPSYVIIVCSGTENWSQAIANFTGRAQVELPNVTGKVHGGFGLQATQVFDAIDSVVEPLLATRTLVLMGHSRGGAVAQILAGIWGAKAKACFCYCFGAPRAGDQAFADSVSSFVIRYENVEDSVCVIPFNQVDTNQQPWYNQWFRPQTGANWADAGEQRSLAFDGQITPDGARPGILKFFEQVTSVSFPYHGIYWYRLRLTRNEPDPFTTPQVVDPPTFNAEILLQSVADTSNQTALAAQGGSMPSPLCAGTFFFKSLDRTFGWTETWYATIDVGSMLAALKPLIPYRLAFLAPDCGIYWYSGRVVEKGAPRSNALFKLPKIKKGTASTGGGVAADSTAMTMDCIVGRLVSSQGSTRQEKWRGLPDAYLEQDGLSGAGWNALDIINSYLLQVKAGGLGIRRQTMLPSAKLAIGGIARNANGNLNLNVPDHGILTIGTFEITVRGRTLGNQMIRAKWNAKVEDANTLQLINSTNFGVGSGGPGGTVTVTSYGNDTLVNPPAQPRLFDFNQTSTIKTGRPSDLHHGKKSAVLRHR